MPGAMSDEFLRELTAVFVTESQERLQATNRHLLALEKADREEWPDLLIEILREMHTLKGASSQIGLDSVSALAHSLETFFGRIRDGEMEPGPAQFDSAYRALDAVTTIVREVSTGTEPEIDVDSICSELAFAGWPQEEGAPLPLRPPASEVEASEPEAGQHERPEHQAGEPGPPRQEAAEPSPPGREAAEPAPPGREAAEPAPPKREFGEPGAPAHLPDETIRVATNKLDSLMAQVGELLISRIAAEQRIPEIKSVARELAEWDEELGEFRTKYRKLPLPRPALDGEEEEFIDEEAVAKLRLHVDFLAGFVDESQQRLRATRASFAEFVRGIEADGRRMSRVTSDLQDSVRRTRMLPVSTVFDPLPRIVRDLAKELGKQVALTIEGAETEVDRAVLEEIRAPLSHLIRNSVDHGVESPEVRVASGKSPEGSLSISASQRGGNLQIEVSDDGAGIDADRVRASAVGKGYLSKDAAAALPDREAIQYIFRPGVSTSAVVTEVSGRGVGMDVVRETVERLHGMLDVESKSGVGTRFLLSLPLTVATTRCLLVRARGDMFALPIANIVRIQRVDTEQVQSLQGRQVMQMDDGAVMVAHLGDVLELSTNGAPMEAEIQERWLPTVVVGSAEQRAGLLVDELAGSQEMVIKNLPWPLVRVRNAAGATVLGTGEILVVLNAADLVRAVTSGTCATVAESIPQVGAGAESGPRTVMVVDDSIVTRSLEKSILENAGYKVRVAAEGAEAWNILQSEACDILVSDIVMPVMDGFELTKKVRADRRLKELPVILVTSLGSDDDHERGVQAGADAYIVKGSFTQDRLLETIRRLI
jgi:two-component system chemotaxis sensor kinase CheA